MRRLANLLGDPRGATAVEFAMVAPAFVLTMLFVMVVGAIMYLNQALDYATSQASRQVLTGAAQSGSMDQATFKANLCSYLPQTMSCGNVVVNLFIVSKGSSPGGYYAFVNPDISGLSIPAMSGGSSQYSVGGRGDYQYLQVIYPITFLPKAFGVMLGGGNTYNGAPAYLAISTAAFRNEQF